MSTDKDGNNKSLESSDSLESLKLLDSLESSELLESIETTITNLPLGYAQKIQLQEKWNTTHDVQSLIDLIKQKPIPVFTSNQLESIQILKDRKQTLNGN